MINAPSVFAFHVGAASVTPIPRPEPTSPPPPLAIKVFREPTKHSRRWLWLFSLLPLALLGYLGYRAGR